ncbi:putative ribonuclease H-like domain-containing protein, partial [Tanacetum coccineum]
HMTGNKCYLTEYEDYDGGFVSFGDGKGRISGKRTRDNIVTGPKDSEEDSGMKPTEVDVSGASDKDGEDDQAIRSEFERLLQQEKQTAHPNSTNSINTVSTPVSTAGPSFTNDALSTPVNAARTSKEHLFEHFSPFKNSFTLPDVPNMFSIDDTGIFGNAYDDKDVGAKVNLNNLETTMNVSPIPTNRIDKDHPKDQIIGDLTLAIQTRRMTKISYEHAMVFRNKKDERGIVIRNKARLIAQGYTQEEGIDYDEVFAPVTRIEAIRLFLAYASFMGFIVYQMDMKSAFSYGTIEEEVYVFQPPSFEDPHFTDKLYKVEKALYGLHQAPRAWYETLSTYLIENGFRRCTIDKTLFINKDKGDILLVQVYVDDIIFGFTKKSLCDEFEASTPMEPNKAMIKDEEAVNVDAHLYRSMIGSLMYLTDSRLDIMFAVCGCARDLPFNLEAFSDNDYAGASLDRKSTTGDVQFLVRGNGYSRKGTKRKPKANKTKHGMKRTKSEVIQAHRLSSSSVFDNINVQQQQVPPILLTPPKDTMAAIDNMAELLQLRPRDTMTQLLYPEIAAANF